MTIASWLRAAALRRVNGPSAPHHHHGQHHRQHHHHHHHSHHGHQQRRMLHQDVTSARLHRPQSLLGGRQHAAGCPFNDRARPLQGGIFLRQFNASAVTKVKPFSLESGFWRETLPSRQTMANGSWAGKGRIFVWAQVIETIAESAYRGSRARSTFSTSSARTESGTGTRGGCYWSANKSFGCHGFQWSRPDPFRSRRSNEAFRGFSTFKATKYWSFGRHGKRTRNALSSLSPAMLVLRHHSRVRAKTGLTYFLTQGPCPTPSAPYTPGTLAPRAISPRVALNQMTARSVIEPVSFAIARTSVLTRGALTKASPFPSRISLVPTSTLTRTFSTTSRRTGLHVLWPFIGVLKSSSALTAFTFVTRFALTVLPLSLRAKVIHVWRERYLRDPENASSFLKRAFGGTNSPIPTTLTPTKSNFYNANNSFIFPALLAAPFLLFAAIVVASLERTPITGRLRVMMLSPQEEADLTASILSVGDKPVIGPSSPQGHTKIVTTTMARDWVTILRSVLELPDEGVSSTTGRRILLGGEVLDERDWRFRWTEAVLRKLEAGIPLLANDTIVKSHSKDPVRATESELIPPPTKYVLKPRATTMTAQELGWQGKTIVGKHRHQHEHTNVNQLATEYELVVIDRAEPNAFSFGFSVDEKDMGADSKGKRGVLVVYTGFIQEVLGGQSASTASSGQALSRSSSLFGANLKPKPIDPIEANLMPPTLPTMDQTQRLAVLLSHELAHLVLSHTLESYASTSLLFPHITKLFSDLVRTFTFPFTALLGPFFNDALGKTINEGTQSGLGFFSQAAHACESRKLELEADVVALRILSHAGIDPRVSLDFWDHRLHSSRRQPKDDIDLTQSISSTKHLHLHSENRNQLDQDMTKSSSFVPPACMFNSHPVDQERVDTIKQEIQRWMNWQSTLQQA
ncbi:hypothetical protein OIO90_005865 [Microbotryomycetes sp. JL221]|nr:hypothetical protein OIO90_005865 [Microbotryomycetes sp. JL221]